MGYPNDCKETKEDFNKNNKAYLNNSMVEVFYDKKICFRII